MKKFLSTTSAIATMVAGVAGLSAPTYAEYNVYTCDALQQAINDADHSTMDSSTIYLSSNITCAADITIPSGKDIFLDLGTSFYMDSNGGINFNNGGSINIEEGATLRLTGSATTNSDSAVIKNYGKLYLSERPVSDEWTTDISNTSGGTAIINYGELNVGSDGIGVIITGDILNNDGVVRLAGGRYTNLDFAETYVTEGCEIEEYAVNTPEYQAHDITCEAPRAIYGHSLPGMFLEAMPLGYSYSITFDHPDLAEAKGYYYGSTEQDIISITGSALDGFTVSAVTPGEAELYSGTYDGSVGMGAIARAYDVTLNGKSILPNDSLANQLIGQDVYAMFDDENYELNAQISAGVADPQYAYDDEDIVKALNGDKAIGLYSIEYIIYDNSDNPLANVTDLNEPLEISLNIPDDLPELAEGYVRKFYVVRKHQDATTGEYQIDILPATIDGDQVKFKSDKFSTFVLAYADVEEETLASEENTEESSKSTASTPDTGAATVGSQAISGVTILGSLIAGIAASFALFPKIRKIVAKK